ncbi:MAG: quinolinate synthase NadA [Planctomycetes bacterium]|nr:quinolinate synthase NadA [Planctomycetota bacterium]
MLWQPEIPAHYRSLSEEELAAGISAQRKKLGNKLLILGHHYQQDDVIQHADLIGDSLQLSRMANREAKLRGSEFILFCGVHFMAETADILTEPSVKVILPDLSAGCSMADMAAYDDALTAWEEIEKAHAGKGAKKTRVIPITYVNSSAAVKAFVGEHDGACCTSSNAKHVLAWAFAGGDRKLAKGERVQVIFMPDQHLGRNTSRSLGLKSEIDAERDGGASDMAVWNPKQPMGGLSAETIRSSKVLLWAGHCSVHKLFRPEHVEEARAADAKVKVLVHPECCQEVVEQADLVGSTEFIIRQIEQAPKGSHWVVGTEVHLVNRLAQAAAERGVEVRMLSDCQCLCTTMYRINQSHMLWCLDQLVQGKIVNQIEVHPKAAALARKALEKMLELAPATGPAPVTID